MGLINLDEITMGELKTLCREGMERWRWSNVQAGRHSADIVAPPLGDPVMRAIRKVGCPLATWAIRLVFSNCIWTHAKKFKESY